MAGFSRVDVTPTLGIGIVGYFEPRFAEGVLDNLEINALALACGQDKVVFLSFDNCYIDTKILREYKKRTFSVLIQEKVTAMFGAVNAVHML